MNWLERVEARAVVHAAGHAGASSPPTRTFFCRHGVVPGPSSRGSRRHCPRSTDRSFASPRWGPAPASHRSHSVPDPPKRTDRPTNLAPLRRAASRGPSVPVSPRRNPLAAPPRPQGGPFGEIGREIVGPHPLLWRKALCSQGFSRCRRGTRTPDTRVMIARVIARTSLETLGSWPLVGDRVWRLLPATHSLRPAVGDDDLARRLLDALSG
jgi:hypothetical protein